MAQTIAEIFATADQYMRTAKFALTDRRNTLRRWRTSLMNAVVFARGATSSLQELRTFIPEFDAWALKKQEEMQADPLMTFFNETHHNIEHEKPIYLKLAGLENIPDLEDAPGEAPPPDAATMFISYGGAGWEIVFHDGRKEKYYLDVDEDVVTRFLAFDAPEFEGRPAQDAVGIYVSRVDAIVSEARTRFLRNR